MTWANAPDAVIAIRILPTSHVPDGMHAMLDPLQVVLGGNKCVFGVFSPVVVVP